MCILFLLFSYEQGGHKALNLYKLHFIVNLNEKANATRYLNFLKTSNSKIF